MKKHILNVKSEKGINLIPFIIIMVLIAIVIITVTVIVVNKTKKDIDTNLTNSSNKVNNEINKNDNQAKAYDVLNNSSFTGAKNFIYSFYDTKTGKKYGIKINANYNVMYDYSMNGDGKATIYLNYKGNKNDILLSLNLKSVSSTYNNNIGNYKQWNIYYSNSLKLTRNIENTNYSIYVEIPSGNLSRAKCESEKDCIELAKFVIDNIEVEEQDNYTPIYAYYYLSIMQSDLDVMGDKKIILTEKTEDNRNNMITIYNQSINNKKGYVNNAIRVSNTKGLYDNVITVDFREYCPYEGTIEECKNKVFDSAWISKGTFTSKNGIKVECYKNNDEKYEFMMYTKRGTMIVFYDYKQLVNPQRKVDNIQNYLDTLTSVLTVK